MGYWIGIILLLWLMSKADYKMKKDYKEIIGEEDFVTCDEMDELICRVDELEEMIKEMRG